MRLLLALMLLATIPAYALDFPGAAVTAPSAASTTERTPDLSGICEKFTINKDGKLDAALITGIGIITAAPDDAYIQLKIKSASTNTMKAAQIDLDRKIDFIIARLSGLFKLKKTNFKAVSFDSALKEQTIRNPSTLVFKDASGKTIQKKEYKYELSKALVISGLAGKKMTDVLEIIDKAVSYGAIAVAEAEQINPSEVESTTIVGEATSKVGVSKGVSKLTINKASEADQNELLNFFFAETTIEKLSAQARGKAAGDAKEKLGKLVKICPFNEKDMDIVFNEDLSATQTSEGELTVKCEYGVNIAKKAQ